MVPEHSKLNVAFLYFSAEKKKITIAIQWLPPSSKYRSMNPRPPRVVISKQLNTLKKRIKNKLLP